MSTIFQDKAHTLKQQLLYGAVSVMVENMGLGTKGENKNMLAYPYAQDALGESVL